VQRRLRQQRERHQPHQQRRRQQELAPIEPVRERATPQCEHQKWYEAGEAGDADPERLAGDLVDLVGTAMAVNWAPKNDVAEPMNIRRYAGWRSGRASIAYFFQPVRCWGISTCCSVSSDVSSVLVTDPAFR
jgi:hypothetical protein